MIHVPKFNFKKYSLLIILFLLAVCYLILSMGLPAGNDASQYYLPMAEAVSRGDWNHAFIPYIPPLVPLLSGLQANILNIDVSTSARIISASTKHVLFFTTRKLLR